MHFVTTVTRLQNRTIAGEPIAAWRFLHTVRRGHHPGILILCFRFSNIRFWLLYLVLKNHPVTKSNNTKFGQFQIYLTIFYQWGRCYISSINLGSRCIRTRLKFGILRPIGLWLSGDDALKSSFTPVTLTTRNVTEVIKKPTGTKYKHRHHLAKSEWETLKWTIAHVLRQNLRLTKKN